MFSKNTSLHASVPLSKRLTFAKEPDTKKLGEELKATSAEMEQTALIAVISLIEIRQIVDIPQLLGDRVVEVCRTLLNCNSTYRKTQNKPYLKYVGL